MQGGNEESAEVVTGQTATAVAQATTAPTPIPTNTPIPIFTPELSPPASTPIPTPTSFQELPVTGASAAQFLPTVIVEAEWPKDKQMDIGNSDSIRVSLVRITEGAYIPTVKVETHTVVVATPAPIVGSTPGAPIESAFGPEYEGFADAELNVVESAFDVKPVRTGEQSLIGAQEITWEWIILPTKPGKQILILKIQAYWKPMKSGKRTIPPREIWHHRLEIFVNEPFITRGQLTISSLASLLISLLSATLAYIK